MVANNAKINNLLQIMIEMLNNKNEENEQLI